jgi:hypothetical protein
MYDIISDKQNITETFLSELLELPENEKEYGRKTAMETLKYDNADRFFGGRAEVRFNDDEIFYIDKQGNRISVSVVAPKTACRVLNPANEAGHYFF